MANTVLRSLNWMAGTRGFGTSSKLSDAVSETTSMQQWVRARAMDTAVSAQVEEDSMRPDAPRATDEEALRGLLRGRGSYDVAAGVANNLAAFEPHLVSLPSDVRDAPAVTALLTPDDAHFLEGESRMLRPEDERSIIGSEPTKPYVDPKLRSSRRMQVKFARQLLDIGLFRATRTRRGTVGIFFVKKKNGSLRLILDCRPTNELFRKPPSTPLATAECLASFEIDDSSGASIADDLFVYIGISDIENAFHRMRMPRWLSDFFCLPFTLCAGDMGMVGQMVDGHKLSYHDELSLAASNLPMGFTWSLFFAQRISEHQISKAPGMDCSTLFNDGTGPLVIDPSKPLAVSHWVYVDNLGLICLGEDLLKQRLSGVVDHFNGIGLTMHETESGLAEMPTLGCKLDCVNHKTKLTVERRVKLTKAIRAVLRRRTVSGIVLEVVLGHATFCCLNNRLTLSIWHTVYKFIRGNYLESKPLWDSVRDELQCCLGLLIYMESSWKLPWCPRSYASDASEAGWGVAVGNWTSGECAGVGRQAERRRFKLEHASKARRHARAEYGLLDFLPDCAFEHDSVWVQDSSFNEVPAKLLHQDKWRVERWGRWVKPEGILTLEARALVKSLRLALQDGHHGYRVVFLCDNMSVVLSFSRARAKNYALLRQVRIFSALCLAFNVKPYIRWIASEVNSADEPSRVISDEKSKNLITELSRIVDVDLPAVPQSVHERGHGVAGSPSNYIMHESSVGTAAARGPVRPPALDGELLGLPAAGSAAQRFYIGSPDGSEQSGSVPGSEGSGWYTPASRGSPAGQWPEASTDVASSSSGRIDAVSHEAADELCAGPRESAPGQTPTQRAQAGEPWSCYGSGGRGGFPDVPEGRGFQRQRRGKFGVLRTGGCQSHSGASCPSTGTCSASTCGGCLLNGSEAGEGGSLFSREGLGEAEDGLGLQRGGGQVRGVRGPCVSASRRGRRGRRVPGELHEQALLRRAPELAWPETHVGFGAHRLWLRQEGREAVASRLEGFEGMAAKDARPHTEAPAMVLLGGGGGGLESEGAFGHGALRAPPGLVLPSSLGMPEPQTGRPHRTSAERVSLVESLDLSGAPRAAVEDGDFRQLNSGGLRGGSELDRAGFGGSRLGRPRRVRLQFLLPRRGGRVRSLRCEPGDQVGGPEPQGALHGAPQRAKHRRGTSPRAAPRGAEKGSLGGLQERAEVRESRPVNAVHAQLPRPDAGLPARDRGCRGKRPARAGGRCTAATRRSMNGRYFGEYFAGKGGVSRVVRRLGFVTKEWELERGPDHDLLKPYVWKRVKQDISQDKVCGCFLGPPCGSFSAINTSVRRPEGNVWGHGCQISENAQRSVEIGNGCMRRALNIIAMCNRLGIPWLLEHPRTSRMWKLPEVIRLLEHPKVRATHLDQCQFGSAWRKSTTILSGNVDEQDLAKLVRQCRPHRRGICSRTGKKHVILRGGCPGTGKPMTHFAAAYPPSLNNMLGRILVDQVRMHENQYEHLQQI